MSKSAARPPHLPASGWTSRTTIPAATTVGGTALQHPAPLLAFAGDQQGRLIKVPLPLSPCPPVYVLCSSHLCHAAAFSLPLPCPTAAAPGGGGRSLASAPRLLFPQPFTCGVTGCTAQHLLEEEAAGKAVCGGAALGRFSWAQQPAQLSCPCSQVQGQ